MARAGPVRTALADGPAGPAGASAAIPGDHMANATTGLPPGVQTMTLETFEMSNGRVLKDVVIAYSTYGTLNAAGDNGVNVGHSLTSNCNVHEWWGKMMGDGKEYCINLQDDFVVCCNYLGSPYGSASPVTPDPSKANGEAYGGDFPAFTIRDQASANKIVMDRLGVKHCRLAIGASMGGMLSMELVVSYPDWIGEVIVVASCGRHTDWAIGLGEVQRAVISTDVNYKGGFYKEDSKPLTGLATARMMAMLSYRAPVSVDEKFSRGTMDEGTKDQRPTFAVESYLRYQGDKFIQRFDTNCYLSLINCLDTHDVAAGRGEYFAVLATVEQRTLVVGIDSDMLYPMALSEELSRYLPNGDLLKINSPHGHDSFLIEIEELNEALIRFRMGQPVAAGAALAAAAAAKGVEALTEALTEAVGRQTSLEKEVVRLNLKLQQMEAKLLKATQGPTASFDELNSIESLRDDDDRVMRMWRRSRSAWGSSAKEDSYNADDYNSATSNGTENPVVYGELKPSQGSETRVNGADWF